MTEAELKRVGGSDGTEAALHDNVTLHGLVEAQIERHASRIAVICDHDDVLAAPALTFARLNERVNQLAHYLRALGVEPGHIVAIRVDRSFAMMVGLLGILKAGAAYLPLSPDDPPDPLDYMLRDGAITVLLFHGSPAKSVTFQGRIVNLDDPAVYRGSTAN